MTTEAPRPTTPPEAQARIEALWSENTRLQELVAQLQARVQTLEARLGQNATNSSRPPSADPPQAPPRPPRSPAGRRPGGQPGHPAHQRALLPPDQVDHSHDHWPARCRRCHASLAPDPDQEVGDPVRQQVVGVPPVRVAVTDHYLHRPRCHTARARRAPACRRRCRPAPSAPACRP